MSSLIFGFAVNFWGLLEDGDDTFQDIPTLGYLFQALMSFAVVSNVYAMIVMSLTEFYVKRWIADGHTKFAKVYMKIFSRYRHFARLAFYCGLIFFLIALIIYAEPHFSRNNQIIMTVIMGGGTVLIAMTTYNMVNPNFESENAIEIMRQVHSLEQFKLRERLRERARAANTPSSVWLSDSREHKYIE